MSYDIEIMNLRNSKPEYPWDFKIDRTSPVGNPFKLSTEMSRDRSCNLYHKYVYAVWGIKYKAHPEFIEYIKDMVRILKEYKKLRLFCWCAPLRCHGESLGELIKEVGGIYRWTK